MSERVEVDLTGVPETMLWTLHNRASEAKRPDSILRDPDAVRIYDGIRYDFTRSFGRADGSHAIRSRLFDDTLRPWLADNRGGTVVELAAGLETQFQRCDDGALQWICVDVPEAIAVRERFLPPSERCRHVAKSALDPAWMDDVDSTRPLFVTAQGLFMYFEESDVRTLIARIADRFEGVELMFDTVPRWLSKMTLRGFGKTKHHRVPPMPWGINRAEIEQHVRSFSRRIDSVKHRPYGYIRGWRGFLWSVGLQTPGLRSFVPSVVHVRTRRSRARQDQLR